MHCRVKCWAFAPPGGLADPHVAEAAQEFCTSVVLGKDWIPRLTVHSFERLRDEMVRTCCERKRKETKRKRKGKKGKNEKKEEKKKNKDLCSGVVCGGTSLLNTATLHMSLICCMT